MWFPIEHQLQEVVKRFQNYAAWPLVRLAIPVSLEQAIVATNSQSRRDYPLHAEEISTWASGRKAELETQYACDQ